MIDVGTDIVDIKRIAALIEKHGPEFCQRFFSERECDYCFAKAHPPQHFAGRFAVKEAVIKILGPQTFKEMEVVNREDGKPLLQLHGEAQKRATALGYGSIAISISHATEQATAVAVASP